eukprot:6010471-Pyramimonas_sp.AAC.1
MHHREAIHVREGLVHDIPDAHPNVAIAPLRRSAPQSAPPHASHRHLIIGDQRGRGRRPAQGIPDGLELGPPHR